MEYFTNMKLKNKTQKKKNSQYNVQGVNIKFV